ncbi:MAG: hypothetical protein ABSB76_02970 [Streptosporangiaceae bacterium]|jgi:hypothetical protein
MHLLGLDQLWIFGYVDLDGVQSPIIAGRTTVVEAGPRDVAVVWPAGGRWP